MYLRSRPRRAESSTIDIAGDSRMSSVPGLTKAEHRKNMQPVQRIEQYVLVKPAPAGTLNPIDEATSEGDRQRATL